MRGIGLKLQQEISINCKEKNFFSLWLVRHLTRLLREVVKYLCVLGDAQNLSGKDMSNLTTSDSAFL